jgi:hypothetical protein
MKTKALYLVILTFLIALPGYSQEKSKKELKEEQKLARQKLTEELYNSKEFVFVGKTALPSGMKSVNLATNPNYLKFQPEMIESEMPFFGTSYSGASVYGRETGMKFKGKPDEFKVEKKSRNFQIDVIVKDNTDTYRISISGGFEGNASLTIISNNRSPITYQGDISALNKTEEVK